MGTSSLLGQLKAAWVYDCSIFLEVCKPHGHPKPWVIFCTCQSGPLSMTLLYPEALYSPQPVRVSLDPCSVAENSWWFLDLKHCRCLGALATEGTDAS